MTLLTVLMAIAIIFLVVVGGAVALAAFLLSGSSDPFP